MGKFLSGFTGHALCLDFFGLPSEHEAAQGLTLHGEAPVARWRAEPITSGIRLWTQLPVARLSVERELLLRDHAPVLYASERLFNFCGQERTVHWVQHVTLGPPLLAAGESVVAIPAGRAKSWPLGYDGKSLVPNDTEFSWPSLGEFDLSRPFERPGEGMVVAALLEPTRSHAFIAAMNWRLGIAIGYCFRRHDFPWVAIWEENQARQDPPWNGRTQARGIEFGTTPMPLGKTAVFDSGPLFGIPTWLTLPARGQKGVGYVAFAASTPHGWRELCDVELSLDTIVLHGPRREKVEINAHGVGEWLQ